MIADTPLSVETLILVDTCLVVDTPVIVNICLMAGEATIPCLDLTISTDPTTSMAFRTTMFSFLIKTKFLVMHSQFRSSSKN